MNFRDLGCLFFCILFSSLAQTKTLAYRVPEFHSVNETPYPLDWYKKDFELDGYPGISLELAKKLFTDNPREIIVAVIDSGVDIEHQALKPRIWINKAEIPNNKIDDDGNGYIDDIVGWNFLGHSDSSATYEVRDKKLVSYKGLSHKLHIQYDSLSVTRKLDDLKNSNDQSYRNQMHIRQLERVIKTQKETIARKIRVYTQELKVYQISTQIISHDNNFRAQNKNVMSARNYINSFHKKFISPKYLESKLDELKITYQSYFQNISEIDSFKKKAVFGNNDVKGPNSSHGTHVAGIIGGLKVKDFEGIAPNVKIMPIKAIPKGDERDFIVAKAIKYAVDNGAKIINLSFGKSHSLNPELVKHAIDYAEEKNVLIIHAAGNEMLNIDTTNNFPRASEYNKNWIEVAASTPENNEFIVASFSNHGKESVDFMAPGTYIYSTLPENTFGSMSGTSLSAPVTAGSLAIVLGKKPELTPSELIALCQENLYWPNVIEVFHGNIGQVKLVQIFKYPGIVNLKNILEKL